MSDFNDLDRQRQAILQIKLDGYVEAAVQAARLNSIGLNETLALVCQALVREFVGYGKSHQVARYSWEEAVRKGYPDHRSERRARAN